MTIGTAMSTYFQKLKKLYLDQFGTLATFPWEENASHQLFISLPDEDGDAQWSPKMAAPLDTSVSKLLCSELTAYYGSWYFLQMRGRIQNIDVDFLPFSSADAASRAAKNALKEGHSYFPNEHCALIATCTVNGIDDMLLFYDQNSGKLFIYDPDKQIRHSIQASLPELIANMEALI